MAETYQIIADLDVSKMEKQLKNIETIASTHAKRISDALGKSGSGLAEKLTISEKVFLASNARQLASSQKTTAQIQALQEKAAAKIAQIHERQVKQQIREHEKMVRAFGQGFDTIARASALAFTGMVAGFGLISKAALSARDDIEELRGMFVGLLGEAGSQQITSFIQSFSLDAGVNLRTDIAAATQTLLQYNNTIAQSQTLLGTLGDAAQATRTNINDLAEAYGGIGEGRFRAKSAASYLGSGATNIAAMVKGGDTAGAQREFLRQLAVHEGAMARFEKNSGLDAISDFVTTLNDNLLIPLGKALGPSLVRIFGALSKAFTPELGQKIATAAGVIADGIATKIVPWIDKMATKLSELKQADVDRWLHMMVRTTEILGGTAAATGAISVAKGVGSVWGPIVSPLFGAAGGYFAGKFGANPKDAAYAKYLADQMEPFDAGGGRIATRIAPLRSLNETATQAKIAQAVEGGATAESAIASATSKFSVITKLLGKLSIWATVIQGAVTGFVDNFDVVRKRWVEAWDEVQATFKIMGVQLPEFGAVLSKIWKTFEEIVSQIGNVLALSVALSGLIVTNVVGAFKEVVEFFQNWNSKGFASAIATYWQDSVSLATNFFAKVWETVQAIFNRQDWQSIWNTPTGAGSAGSNIGALRQSEWTFNGKPMSYGQPAVPVTPPGGGSVTVDYHKQVAGYITSYLGQNSEAARKEAEAIVGGTSNLCAATAAAFFRHLGFNIPTSVTTTTELETALRDAGAAKVDLKGFTAGEVLFWKDLKNTTTGGGPNKMPDHAVTIQSVNEDGTVTYVDQYGPHTVGVKTLRQKAQYGYRFSDKQFTGGLQGMTGFDTPVDKVREQVQAALKKAQEDRTKLTESWDKTINEKSENYQKLQSSTDQLRSAFDGLKGSIGELSGSFGELKASRADYFGNNIEAAAIRADSVMEGIQSTWKDIQTLKGGKGFNPNDPVSMAQLNALYSQLSQQVSSGYNMAGGLKDQPGFDKLSQAFGGDLEKFVKDNNLMDVIGKQITDSGPVLLSAGNGLVIAATMLQQAAQAISNAQAAKDAALLGMSAVTTGFGNVGPFANLRTSVGIPGIPGSSGADWFGAYATAPAAQATPGGHWEDIADPNCPDGKSCGPIGRRWVQDGSPTSGAYGNQFAGQRYVPSPQKQQAAPGQSGFDWMGGALMPLAQAAAGAYANGQPIGQSLIGAVPGILSNIGGSMGPFGSILGTLAGGLFTRIFGRKSQPKESVKPVPVVIQNWDVLGSMLNITRSSMVRGSGAGISAISQMRVMRESVGI